MQVCYEDSEKNLMRLARSKIAPNRLWLPPTSLHSKECLAIGLALASDTVALAAIPWLPAAIQSLWQPHYGSSNETAALPMEQYLLAAIQLLWQRHGGSASNTVSDWYLILPERAYGLIQLT
jgi:hypothetical protein